MPAGHAEPVARRCFDAGKLMIDLGADFRLENEADYRQWYGGQYADPALHKEAVYCIPELHRACAHGAKLIANPGCYVTSACLGLAPAVKSGAVDLKTIVIDAKSLSLIHISEPTRQAEISYAVFCLKKKKKKEYRLLLETKTI